MSWYCLAGAGHDCPISGLGAEKYVELNKTALNGCVREEESSARKGLRECLRAKSLFQGLDGSLQRLP